MGNRREAQPGLEGLPTDLKGRIGKVSNPSSEEAIYFSTLLQTVSPEDWEANGYQVIGKVEGPQRHVPAGTVRQGSREITYQKPVRTRFVQIVDSEGQSLMQVYKPELHGEWDAIKPIGWIEQEVGLALGLREDQIREEGMSPEELADYLEGFAIDDTQTQGHQFGNERKRGASDGHWPVRHQPDTRK